jgi:hypothetical protein
MSVNIKESNYVKKALSEKATPRSTCAKSWMIWTQEGEAKFVATQQPPRKH